MIFQVKLDTEEISYKQIDEDKDTGGLGKYDAMILLHNMLGAHYFDSLATQFYGVDTEYARASTFARHHRLALKENIEHIVKLGNAPKTVLFSIETSIETDVETDVEKV